MKLTYADYLTFPEDGLRHELLDGEHVVSASPSNNHQMVVRGLMIQLWEQVMHPGHGEVMLSPSDIVLSDTDVVQPDLYVMLGKNIARLREPRTFGPPDLAIEVLSPSTASVDRGKKLAVFARHGVREVWLVDPDQQVLEQYELRCGALQLRAAHTQAVDLVTVPGAVVDLTQVW